jgi:toxin ParE1/3/4
VPRRRRVRFAQAAQEELDEVWQYVQGESGPARASALIDGIVAGCRRLEDAPSLGRPMRGLGPGVRMLVVERYRVLYRILGDRVEIDRVIHSRRDFPKAWRERDPDAHS